MGGLTTKARGYRQEVSHAYYLEHALHPGVEQLPVHVSLQGRQLPDELEVPGEPRHGVRLAGVAVPAQEGVVGGAAVQHVLQDVVDHLAPARRLDAERLAAAVERGAPLALLAHRVLPVGRAVGRLDVGRAHELVDAADAAHSVRPDVGRVRGEERAHQPQVLRALEEQHQPVVEAGLAPAATQDLKVVDELLDAPLLGLRLPAAELGALVVPGGPLLAPHEAGLGEPGLGHAAGHHQALVVGVLFLRQPGGVQADLGAGVRRCQVVRWSGGQVHYVFSLMRLVIIISLSKKVGFASACLRADFYFFGIRHPYS